MFGFLKRWICRGTPAKPVPKPPEEVCQVSPPERIGTQRKYHVELDPSDGKVFSVQVLFPECCIAGGVGYTARLVDLATEVVPGTSFELLYYEHIPNFMDAGDRSDVYRVGDSRPNLVALLACNLRWSPEAKLLAASYSISDLELDAVREQMKVKARGVLHLWPQQQYL